MRALIQRVNSASVEIEGRVHSSIGKGLLILLGIEHSDGQEDILWLSNKIAGLRVFDDENGVMNRSVKEINGSVMVVSQFTLHARIKKGFRPSYVDAAPPELSIPLYQQFVGQLETDLDKQVATGIFGAEMQITLVNDGPVTIMIDTKNRI
jgi:D-aminoacyl-tRNA deacylase